MGTAWTGIDLSNPSVPANKDRILTDLVIPRFPFGTNRTSTHKARKQKNKVAGAIHEILDTAIKMKQGMGRLVRREGVPPKRLWILDSRIHKGSWTRLTSQIKLLLNAYQKQKKIEPQ